jgi:hypothetical protein
MTRPRHEQSRRLRPEEVILIAEMLSPGHARSEFITRNSGYYVQDMNDGGMGSIRFLAESETDPRFAGEIARAEYLDRDGILVSITINSNQHGELYEVDFWKTDFSPLHQYPEPSQLRITARKVDH